MSKNESRPSCSCSIVKFMSGSMELSKLWKESNACFFIIEKNIINIAKPFLGWCSCLGQSEFHNNRGLIRTAHA